MLFVLVSVSRLTKVEILQKAILAVEGWVNTLI